MISKLMKSLYLLFSYFNPDQLLSMMASYLSWTKNPVTLNLIKTQPNTQTYSNEDGKGPFTLQWMLSFISSKNYMSS